MHSAVQAENYIREDFRMTPDERKLLWKTGTVDGFLAMAKDLEEKHRNKKGGVARDTFAQSVENFQVLAKAFQPVVDAVAGAATFGAGNLAWGLCSVVLTVSESLIFKT